MPHDFQQDIPEEDELKAALGGVRIDGNAAGNCPTPGTLRDFLAGKYSQDDMKTATMLDHLANCESCDSALTRIRTELLSEPEARPKGSLFLRWPVWKLAFAVFSAAVLLTTWFWATRNREVSVSILDLRQITRGVESSRSPARMTLHITESSTKIVLPIGSVGGRYEVGLFQGRDSTPLLSAFADATSENDTFALNVSLTSQIVPPGSYFLGIRPPESTWVYYPITID